ncbi:unnamed protein product [Dibothriocephalus latus]|uniref:EGF-like domain-containing protein n=1 Tax=Dibothriocephalus latus TaxID=60516 RepID=A0A3P7LJ23_DIBLA|nr:unnamed protein product [Dibothriocephalus latus]
MASEVTADAGDSSSTFHVDALCSPYSGPRRGVCINLPGSYHCNCSLGYAGRNCQIKNLTPLNPDPNALGLTQLHVCIIVSLLVFLLIAALTTLVLLTCRFKRKAAGIYQSGAPLHQLHHQQLSWEKAGQSNVIPMVLLPASPTPSFVANSQGMLSYMPASVSTVRRFGGQSPVNPGGVFVDPSTGVSYTAVPQSQLIHSSGPMYARPSSSNTIGSDRISLGSGSDRFSVHSESRQKRDQVRLAASPAAAYYVYPVASVESTQPSLSEQQMSSIPSPTQQLRPFLAVSPSTEVLPRRPQPANVAQRTNRREGVVDALNSSQVAAGYAPSGMALL